MKRMVALLVAMGLVPTVSTAFAITVQQADTQSVSQFKGLNFGIGLGFSIDLASGESVESVAVVDSVVRITAQRNDIPRVLLESHYFFVGDPKDSPTLGYGPFMAIQTGGKEIIEAFAAGFMIGWRRAKVVGADDGAKSVKTDSFNIGIGAILDNRALELRDGVVANEKITDSGPLTKETSRWGLLVAFSFNF